VRNLVDARLASGDERAGLVPYAAAFDAVP
jgi:hypothetical protein